MTTERCLVGEEHGLAGRPVPEMVMATTKNKSTNWESDWSCTKAQSVLLATLRVAQTCFGHVSEHLVACCATHAKLLAEKRTVAQSVRCETTAREGRSGPAALMSDDDMLSDGMSKTVDAEGMQTTGCSVSATAADKRPAEVHVQLD